MSKDKGRPKNLKGNAPLDKVMVSCDACIRGDHTKCRGLAAENRVKCLCAWSKHRDDF